MTRDSTVSRQKIIFSEPDAACDRQFVTMWEAAVCGVSVLLTPLACRHSGEVLNSGRITGTCTRRMGRPLVEGGQISQVCLSAGKHLLIGNFQYNKHVLALDPAGTSKK